jgi:hypothetical protein
MLNLNAWLIFELCANASADGLQDTYLSAVAKSLPKKMAQEQLGRGVEQLISHRLIEFVPVETSDSIVTSNKGDIP